MIVGGNLVKQYLHHDKLRINIGIRRKIIFKRSRHDWLDATLARP